MNMGFLCFEALPAPCSKHLITGPLLSSPQTSSSATQLHGTNHAIWSPYNI